MSENKNSFDAMDTVSRIADIVNKSIDSGDYSSLNREITKTLNSAADAIHDGIAGAVTGTPFFKVEGAKTYRADTRSSYEDAQRKNQSELASTISSVTGSDGVASPVGAYVQAFLGGLATFGFGIFTIGAFATTGFGLFSIFFLAVTAVSGWNLFRGLRKISLMRRARKILKMMDKRDTITIEEIAASFGMKPEKVADDVQEMMRDSVFTGRTYMDKEETAFMTSHEAYNQYLETMKAYIERTAAQRENAQSVFNKKDLKEYSKMEKQAAQRETNQARAAANLDKETREMVEEGRAFIAHIHRKNEEVPEAEFTEKLNRLEKIVTDIFDRVAAAPESAPDLHRLMKYYLPTTQKLVDTYATLDKQNVQGENVQTAKREIKDSLDTINEAFEKFLDQFFQATAWDVSSDISVMNQMMHQDGLVGGNDFARSTAAAQAATAAYEAQTSQQAQAAQAAQAAQGAQQAQAAQGAQQAQAAQATQTVSYGGVAAQVQAEEQK